MHSYRGRVPHPSRSGLPESPGTGVPHPSRSRSPDPPGTEYIIQNYGCVAPRSLRGAAGVLRNASYKRKRLSCITYCLVVAKFSPCMDAIDVEAQHLYNTQEAGIAQTGLLHAVSMTLPSEQAATLTIEKARELWKAM